MTVKLNKEAGSSGKNRAEISSSPGSKSISAANQEVPFRGFRGKNKKCLLLKHPQFPLQLPDQKYLSPVKPKMDTIPVCEFEQVPVFPYCKGIAAKTHEKQSFIIHNIIQVT